MKPNTGARMVTNALTMQEWTCRKEILLSQKYTFTLETGQGRQPKNSNNSSSLKWTVHLVPFFYITLVMEECPLAIGCDQQNNNKDCGPFSIANATELAFKGNPGIGRGVSTDRLCRKGCFHGPPVLSGVYCFAVFVWTRETGLVFLLSIFSGNTLTKWDVKHIVPAHDALLVSWTQWKGLMTFPMK